MPFATWINERTVPKIDAAIDRFKSKLLKKYESVKKFHAGIPRRLKRIIYVFLFIFGFYLTSIYHIEPNEMGIGWNPFTGKLRADTVPGFYVSPPWDFVSNIDLRPKRVCITSSANSYGCLLVRFDKRYWKEFIAVQGFEYYWWSNRFSFNSGYKEEYRGFKDVLRGYAFGNREYKFIVITEDLSTQYE